MNIGEERECKMQPRCKVLTAPLCCVTSPSPIPGTMLAGPVLITADAAEVVANKSFPKVSEVVLVAMKMSVELPDCPLGGRSVVDGVVIVGSLRPKPGATGLPLNDEVHLAVFGPGLMSSSDKFTK